MNIKKAERFLGEKVSSKEITEFSKGFRLKMFYGELRCQLKELIEKAK